MRKGKYRRAKVVHVLCKCCEASVCVCVVCVFVLVCEYSVGPQINPVGFILSEWDSGALQ